jgi:hypothetical protein
MKLKFSGSVFYANGDPISGVRVRIFDKDSAGKQDDDLTITPGISDGLGKFELTYEPLRFVDYHTSDVTGTPEEPFNTSAPGNQLPDLLDIYQPYLQFYYTVNSIQRQHSTPFGIFQKKFHLPENPPVDFLPSACGFKFTNSFSGYFLPFSTPAFLGAGKVTSKYGLCGGMCAGAYDYSLAGRPIPPNNSVPHQGTRLQRYLFQRQMDSLGGMGQQVIKVAQWTSLPTDTPLGTQARTANEFASARQRLDDKNLVVFALIYEHASAISELARVIFNNHQVLAYACLEDSPGDITVRVYDPNLPERDDVTINLTMVQLGEVTGLKSTQLVAGEFYREVRGFFAMPYSPVVPPKGL